MSNRNFISPYFPLPTFREARYDNERMLTLRRPRRTPLVVARQRESRCTNTRVTQRAAQTSRVRN